MNDRVIKKCQQDLGHEAIKAACPEPGLADLRKDAAETIANIFHYVESQGEDVSAVILLAQLQYGKDLLDDKYQTSNEDRAAGWLNWEEPVNESSRIKRLRYNATTFEMDVMFPQEARYRVSNVMPTQYDDLRTAGSPGSYYHMAIVKDPEGHPVTKLS